MLFKKKSPAQPSISIRSREQLLYEGLLRDVPLKEAVIIEKSIRFFDDPEPCFIHRNAVRVRLISEIQKELLERDTESPGSLLLSYVDFEDITACCLL